MKSYEVFVTNFSGFLKSIIEYHPPFILPSLPHPPIPLPPKPSPPYPPLILPQNKSNPPSTTVTIRFQPIGSAPHLKQRIFKISSSNNFSTVVNFLRKKLFDPKTKSEAGEGKAGGNGQGGGSVFCYVNSVFAPGLDEGVGGLWRVSDFVDLDRGIGGKA